MACLFSVGFGGQVIWHSNYGINFPLRFAPKTIHKQPLLLTLNIKDLYQNSTTGSWRTYKGVRQFSKKSAIWKKCYFEFIRVSNIKVSTDFSQNFTKQQRQTCGPCMNVYMCTVHILRALLCSIDNDVWYCLFIHSYTNLCCVLLSNKDHTFSTFSFFSPSFPSPSSLSCPFSSHHHSPLFSSNIPWPPVES